MYTQKPQPFPLRAILIPLIVALLVFTGGACCLFALLAHMLFSSSASQTVQQNTATSQEQHMYMALAQQDAKSAGIPVTLFARQIQVESGFNPTAQSPSGAEGIAQFMPSTAASLGIDPWNPRAALQGAANLMAHYTRMYSGDYAKALAAYNAGPGATQQAIQTCGESTWTQCLPQETQQYIQHIMQ